MLKFIARQISLFAVTAAAAGILAAPGDAFAQGKKDKFPDKTIQVVIHSSYGGGTDVTARMMMIRSRRNLKTDMQETCPLPSGRRARQGWWRRWRCQAAL